MAYAPLPTDIIDGDPGHEDHHNRVHTYINDMWLDPRDPDFGGVGDGTTVDTVPVQAAFDALPTNGGQVFISGWWLVGHLTVDSDAVALIGAGPGSRLICKSGTNNNLLRVNTSGDVTATARLSRFTMRDLVLDHQGSQQADPGGGVAGCVAVFAVDRVEVHNCEVLNAKSVGLAIDACSVVRVQDNTIDTVVTGLAENGINVIGTEGATATATDFIVTGNFLIDCPGDGIDAIAHHGGRVVVANNIATVPNLTTTVVLSNGSPLPFAGIAVETGSAAHVASDTVVVGNVSYGINDAGVIVRQYGIYVGNSVNNPGGITNKRSVISSNLVVGASAWGISANEQQVAITSNVLDNVHGGIVGGQEYEFDQPDWVVSNNQITYYLTGPQPATGGEGIALDKGLADVTMSNVVVTDNQIECNQGFNNGIFVKGTVQRFIIEGNLVTNSINAGIQAGSAGLPVSFGTIDGNEVYNSGSGGNATFNCAGIAIVGACDEIQVRGNRSRDMRAGGARTQKIGIFVDTTATNIDVLSNNVRNNSVIGVSATESDTVWVAGNRGYKALHVVGAASGPAFQNSWAAYGGYMAPRYYRDIEGTVFLEGMAQGGAVGSVLFTLPAGFRPSAKVAFAVASNAAFGWLSVDSAGLVKLEAGSGTWVALSTVRFLCSAAES